MSDFSRLIPAAPGESARKGQATMPGTTEPEVVPVAGTIAAAPAATSKAGHRATYATDKRNGGYLIRVAGPYPEKFAGREVPVTLKSGAQHPEKLTRLIWTGNDAESGEKVALYKFEPKPRDDAAAELPF